MAPISVLITHLTRHVDS